MSMEHLKIKSKSDSAAEADAVRRHSPSLNTATKLLLVVRQEEEDDNDEAPNASNSSIIPPLYHSITIALFFTLFFSVVYYLLVRWRDKIRNSTPLHLLNLSEIAALLAFLASFFYLQSWFFAGIPTFFHPIRPAVALPDDDDEPDRLEPRRHYQKHRHLPIIATPTDNNNNKDAVDENAKKNTPKKEELVLEVPGDGDEELIQSVVSGKIPSYSLESNKLLDCRRAAFIRREAVQRITGKSLEGLPVDGFDYESILGQCCEMPIGYVQIPVGVAGPLLLDGAEYTVPMATTEGCLVASTNRGCKAIYASGGATSILLNDAMTRAPVVRFATAKRAAELKFFVEEPLNFEALAAVFNKTSRFGRLRRIKCAMAGKNVYMRFTCSTGDAMGMNMVSKGVQNVLVYLTQDSDRFPDMEVMGISGNYCSDKKPAAVNWIEGRGKSVMCEAIIKDDVVKKVLKTDVASLVELNMLKNLTGSAMAGALGGFNAHASNIVTAVYIATGQDPAQNVESSHCITMMEAVNEGKDLHVSVTMPSIEVGTVGGGTQLASQAACLNLLGVKGASKESPGLNARQLARIVAGSVLAGELSLMSALAAGQLVKSHMKYNRSNKDVSKV